MLSMPASDIGIRRYRQNRFVIFMVSSIQFPRAEKLPRADLFVISMLAGLAPAAQAVDLHACQAERRRRNAADQK
jgi:hypothetical protein